MRKNHIAVQGFQGKENHGKGEHGYKHHGRSGGNEDEDDLHAYGGPKVQEDAGCHDKVCNPTQGSGKGIDGGNVNRYPPVFFIRWLQSADWKRVEDANDKGNHIAKNSDGVYQNFMGREKGKPVFHGYGFRHCKISKICDSYGANVRQNAKDNKEN